jgi:hypothetical protein
MRCLLLLSLLLTNCRETQVTFTKITPDTARLRIMLEGQTLQYTVTAVTDLTSNDAKLHVQTGNSVTTQPITIHAYRYVSAQEKVIVVVNDHHEVESVLIMKNGEQYAIMSKAGKFEVRKGSDVPWDKLQY